MPAFGYIALVDGDAQRRSDIRKSLLTEPIHVEPFESVAELSAHSPRAAILLLHNEDGSVAALRKHMSERGTWVPIISYSEDPTPNQIVEAVHDGAVGYLAWPFADGELAQTFVATGRRFAEVVDARQRVAAARVRFKHLTRREREVLSGVAAGLSNRKIGQKLGISPRTVELHRTHMLAKIGAHHTSEVVRFAIEAEVIA